MVRQYTGLNMSKQQIVGRLNDLSHYVLYFPGEHTKQLVYDEIIEILDQIKVLE
jgi:hypothetical protein